MHYKNTVEHKTIFLLPPFLHLPSLPFFHSICYLLSLLLLIASCLQQYSHFVIYLSEVSFLSSRQCEVLCGCGCVHAPAEDTHVLTPYIQRIFTIQATMLFILYLLKSREIHNSIQAAWPLKLYTRQIQYQYITIPSFGYKWATYTWWI